MAVFRVDNLTNPTHKFKVNMNAQQLHLGGICLVADQNTVPDLPNLVIVEGGPRAIKKYKTLMLRRIKWDEKLAKQQEENSQR